jgi:hypothetical protein
MKWTIRWLPLTPAGAVAISWLAIMLTGGAITAVVLPPFQAPDENHHFLRAAQIADGSFLPLAVDGYPGSLVDSGYLALQRVEAISELAFHPSAKLDRAAVELVYSLRIQRKLEPTTTPNVGYYLATGYLPQAAGIRLARSFSDRVMIHVVFARVLNCLVASLLIAFAICLFPPAMPIFIAVSALPMSLFLLSSTSQDALLIANSMLLAAISMRLLCGAATPLDSTSRPTEERWLGVAAFVVTLLLAFGRPPYLALALVPASVLLILDWRRYWKPVTAAVLLMAAAVLSYLKYVQGLGPQLISNDADPAAQWRVVMADPSVFLQAVLHADYGAQAYEAVGVLGWLDTLLPGRLYVLARWALLIALAATALAFASSTMRARGSPWSRSVIVVLAGIVAVATATVLSDFIIYLINTAVGDTTGVRLQGRYFLPFLPILACAILAPLLSGPILLPPRIADRLFSAATCGISVLLLGAMIASFAVMDITLIDRYYLR